MGIGFDEFRSFQTKKDDAPKQGGGNNQGGQIGMTTILKRYSIPVELMSNFLLKPKPMLFLLTWVVPRALCGNNSDKWLSHIFQGAQVA